MKSKQNKTMRCFALLAILLMPISTFAATVTVDVYGTNISNAQTNLTQIGNNSYTITAWGIGDATKRMQADINGNASDAITFTLHNFTAGRVIEVKVNSSSFNSYQADSTGTISFTRVQTIRNQTYSITSAVNIGGYNFTWMQLWTWPSLFGVNFTQYFLPYSGATADLNMNNRNITNVRTINSTTVNVTTLNATNVQGNGSGLTYLNASNLTTGVLPNASIPLSAANLSTDNNFAGSIGINTAPAYRGDISGSFRVQGTAQAGAAAGAGLEVHPGGTIQIYGFNRTAGTGMPISFQEAGTEKVIFYGNVGICGNSTPANVLACTVGSATDPIADSWLQYSTPESKIVLGEADNLTEKYRADFRNTTVYRWKRTANEPERLGVLAKKGTPPEILAYHDGKNNTNSTASNATLQGIDLGAYIGWLHEIVKGQDMQLQQQQRQIDYLYKQLNMTKP